MRRERPYLLFSCLHFCDALSVSVLPLSYVMVSVVVHVRDFEHRMEIRNV